MDNRENKEFKIDLTNTSNIENVDYAFYDWVNKELNLFCNTKNGLEKTPVLWVTPERSFQIKNNKELRDANGAITLPLITVERTNIQQSQKDSAVYYNNTSPNNNRQIISRRINQKKTSEFANADYQKQYGLVQFARPKKNQKIVYEFKNMLLPIYATFTYNVNIFTQFQQQMNELLQPFITRNGSKKYFLIERDGYSYECFIEPNFDTKNNINSMEEEERRFLSTITVKVLANLLSDGQNEKEPIIKVFENAVELKIPRESIILQQKEEPKIPTQVLGGAFASQVSSNVAIKKIFSIGGGTSQNYSIKHGLNTRDMYVSVREASGDFLQVTVGVTYDSLDQITIDMGEAVGENSHIVTIIG